jgi:opacity protein-like surface antigen
MRSTILLPLFTTAAVCLLTLTAVPCAAQSQGFGLGARMSMIRGDVSAGTSAERFTGGQIRARVSPRTAIELSADLRTKRSEDLTQRVRDLPVQASLVLYPVPTTFAPYVLGGGGWYYRRVESLLGDEVLDSETTRKFGWHAGFGAELRLGRHAGVHADYRYTFLKFGSDEPETDTIAGAVASAHARQSAFGNRFLPSYEGSMWTAGITLYF